MNNNIEKNDEISNIAHNINIINEESNKKYI